MLFDKFYEKFKRFCVGSDEAAAGDSGQVTGDNYDGDSVSDGGWMTDGTEVPTYTSDATEQPIFTDTGGYMSSEPGTIKMMSYFTIDEMCRSTKARLLGISNIPPSDVVRNLQMLIDNILDPLRRAYGKPITVNSGYRCYALNVAVGGVPNSQHLTGKAADITGGSKTENKRLWELIRQLDLPIDQCIDESNLTWVHVSYDPTRNRKQFLKL